MILKNERNEPPGGWRYKQEDTGLSLMEDSLSKLCRKVADHRRYKDLKGSLDLDQISLEVQRQICAGMNNSEVFCRSEFGFVNQPRIETSESFEFETSGPEPIPQVFKKQEPKPDTDQTKTTKKVARKRHARRSKKEQD